MFLPPAGVLVYEAGDVVCVQPVGRTSRIVNVPAKRPDLATTS
jgi:hypothetical protein